MDSSRFFLNYSDRILTEFWCQKFDLFDRSPIESFNPGRRGRAGGSPPRGRRAARGRAGADALRRGLSCWWIGVHHQILMNWWICSLKIDELLHHFLANFEKMVQKIVTSGNCLQFPEIPTKINAIFTEKSAISVKFHWHFEKNLQKSSKCAKIWKFWNVSGAKVCRVFWFCLFCLSLLPKLSNRRTKRRETISLPHDEKYLMFK